MSGKDIVSIIAVYVSSIGMILLAHLCASVIDANLYKHNKLNDNRKTIKVGLNWLFWRVKKENKKEIFIIAFVHECINLTLFIAMTSLLIIALVQKNEYFNAINFPLAFIYVCYCVLIERHIDKKLNKKVF